MCASTCAAAGRTRMARRLGGIRGRQCAAVGRSSGALRAGGRESWCTAMKRQPGWGPGRI